uniref:Coiled-coil domain-containing protein 172 n=1 Tax=Xenopus tropicalis TaxID=8364 RepID=A0A803JF94_XENTR
MSLDSLLQYILLTEQQASEMNLREVKSEIHRCQEKVRSLTGRLEEAKATLETKVQLLAEKQCERLLLKKHRDVLESQKEDLLKEKEKLLTMHEGIKKEMAEEEEKFIKEVMEFNNNYGLTSNRDLLLREQAKAEMEQLDMEAEALMSEIESLKHESFHVKALQVQKKTLSDNLAQLQNTLKDVEDKLCEAVETTERLKAEKLLASQKPQSDAECLRLKKELESYSSDDSEAVYEALRLEIDFLQTKISQQ